jgi:predicted dehydrogenase
VSSRSPEVVLAGAGPMAEEHLRALLACGVDASAILVVGRSRERTEALAGRYGVRAVWGGVETVDESAPLAIVAVTETEAPEAARVLSLRGARHVLLEKPGALASATLGKLLRATRASTVVVGYNRRFYPSVERARTLAEEDGGAIGLAFEFTEIEDLVLRDRARRDLSEEVLARWGAANSLHVIDLAFHLAGEPRELSVDRAGSLDWHPAGAVFAGSGRTHTGALFVYLATWSGAGRWGVEVTTRARRLVLRPLEELRQQTLGRFELEPVELPAEPHGLKPGIHGQLRAFLDAARTGATDPRLCTLEEAIGRLELAEKIFGYA